MEHALAVLDCIETKRGLLERLEGRICERESSKDEDEDEDMEGGGADVDVDVDIDVESGDMEDKDLLEPWGCLARSVYPPLINHTCLLDAESELNKKRLDDVMEPPTRLDALLDTAEGEKLERMDGYNAKRHERMLWGLVGKGDEIRSDEEEEEEEETSEYGDRHLTRMYRRAGGPNKSKSGPLVDTSSDSG